MATDVIPAKYKRILKLIKINTDKPKNVIRTDFLEFYKETCDFQKSMILLHNKYTRERKKEKKGKNDR